LAPIACYVRKPLIHHVEVQVLVLLLVAAFVGMGAHRFRLPYTLALVVAGLALGVLDLGILHDVELNAELLLLLLLPALLFEAAFHIELEEFRRNLVPIFTLAVPGVMLAASATAALAYLALGVTGLVPDFSWREAWLFAAVISATDPVSVLALFRQFGVPKRLYLVVEGESLLNDGVAVVLFVVVSAAYGVSTTGRTMDADASLLSFGLETFLVMGVGGSLIGAALGGVFTLVTRTIDDHLIETTLTTLLAYGSFLIAEQAHCSGVLSTVFAGIVAGSYGARLGMTASTRNAVEDFWEYMAFLANSFIFLLVGLELVPIDLLREMPAVVLAFVAVGSARAMVVYIGVPISNRFSRPLPRAWTHVMVWGGLRGSLSMVLILTLPASFPGRAMLVTLVFGVVGVSLFVQGLTMGPLLRRLGLLEGKQRHDDYERARAIGIMSRRALDELDALARDGVVEPTVVERLRAWYLQRSAQADRTAGEALGAGRFSQQVAETLRRLAEVERRGIREATQAAVIDVDIAERLDRELVMRLAALDEAQGSTAAALDAAIDDLIRDVAPPPA